MVGNFVDVASSSSYHHHRHRTSDWESSVVDSRWVCASATPSVLHIMVGIKTYTIATAPKRGTVAGEDRQILVGHGNNIIFNIAALVSDPPC